MAYTRGLHEVGDGLFAYLQPDGGWGWSNAGLIVDGEHSLLIDTLFDLRLTEEMLQTMRRAVPAAAQIDTLVNTHANGDHCYGNQLVGDALIVASERTAQEMSELPPAAMAALIEQAPQMGVLGEFFIRCFGAFDFDGIELVLPRQTFDGSLALHVGERELELIEVGPAHTRGDTIVHVPAEGVVFTGDILFSGAPSDRVGRPGVELDRRLRADRRAGAWGDRAGARSAQHDRRGARAAGVLRIPL
ncbi:MAG TPA: MBL fold metallo-hydrolase [Solirubrobacteraceae bacterium]|jgi:glyoxylase-like metal-dependent hydrolase (beta-lactamase superfamily II)